MFLNCLNIVFISAVDTSALTTGGTGEASGGSGEHCEEPGLPDDKMSGWSFVFLFLTL